MTRPHAAALVFVLLAAGCSGRDEQATAPPPPVEVAVVEGDELAERDGQARYLDGIAAHRRA